MPVYNRSHTLRRAVDSVLRQTYRDFELILVDDGSTDGSLALCREYERADSRVKVFHSENRGVSHARNLGLRQAAGAYIRFADSDDELPESSLEDLIGPVLKNGAIQLVVANVEGDMFEGIPAYSSGLMSREAFLRQFFQDELRDLYYGPGNKLYLKPVLRANSLSFDESLRWGEDTLFNFRYYMCVDKIYLSDRTVYRVHHPPGESGHLSGGDGRDFEGRVRFSLLINDVYREAAAQVMPDYDSVCTTFLIELLWQGMSLDLRRMYPAFRDAVCRHDWKALLPDCRRDSFYWGYRFFYDCLIKKRALRLFCFFRVKNRLARLVPHHVKTALRPYMTRRRKAL